MPRPEIDPRLIEALTRAGEGRGWHSSMHHWMREHFHALRKDFRENGPGWPGLVALFRKWGLTDRDGKPPTIRSAQQTWYRLCRAVAQEGGGGGPPESVSLAARVAADVMVVPAAPAPDAPPSAGATDRLRKLALVQASTGGRVPPEPRRGFARDAGPSRGDQPAPVRRLKRATLGGVPGDVARSGEGTPPGVRQLRVINKQQGSNDHGDEEGRDGGG